MTNDSKKTLPADLENTLEQTRATLPGARTPAEIQSGDTRPKDQVGVGYGRPPKHSRFRKNQSGNPSGRKKGTKHVLPQIWDVYLRPKKVRDGGKIRSEPAIVALHEMHMARGLQSDIRSAAIAFKFAADIGLYTLPEPQVIRHEVGFTREELRELSSETIEVLIEAHKKGVAELVKKGVRKTILQD